MAHGLRVRALHPFHIRVPPPTSPGSSYLLKASAMRQSQRSVLQSVDIIVAMETDWIDAVAKQFLLVAGH